MLLLMAPHESGLPPPEQPEKADRLHFMPGFMDVWVDGVHYDLREQPRIRLCVEYLVQKQAFTRERARHLKREIDEYVRKRGDYLQAAELKIGDYFKGQKGKFLKLRQSLIGSAGNGKYYLRVHG